MSIFNALITGLFDILLYPFRSMPPLVGLCIISIVLGILLLLLYKYTSPQKMIKRIKDKMKASLYEVRLYKDDLGIVFRANKSLLANNIKYFSCNLIPLIPLIFVVIPIIIQLDVRYGIGPLKAGEATHMKVILSDDVDFETARVDVEIPDGLRLDAGPVRIPAKHEYFFRIFVEKAGQYDLNVKVNGESYTKRIDAEESVTTVSPGKYKASMVLDAFERPCEKPWPSDSRVKAVELDHQYRKDMVGIPGDLWPWLWVFCIVGLASGFAVKGVFNVTL
ncbi:MAG: hypothetical protein ACYTG7_10330 [Planctomycetota bacterium]|jgi:hypothetical protein